MFSCVFVTLLNDVLGQVRYLIESIPDLCLLPFFRVMSVFNYYFCIFSEDNIAMPQI